MKMPAPARRAGLPGLIGVLAMLVAVLLVGFVTRPLRIEYEALQAQARATESRLRGGEVEGDNRTDPADELEAFHASFPHTEASTELLKQIHSAAKDQGLNLTSGEYRIEKRPGDVLVRYVITLPLTGNYQELRAFIAAVLAGVPAAAIDDIQLRRESAASPAIEARVRLSLYLRAG